MPDITAAPAPGEVSEAQHPSQSLGTEQPYDQAIGSAPSQEKNGQPADGQSSALEAGAKPEGKRHESRYERTKRQKQALNQREALIRQREERIAQAERAHQAQQKPKRDYTLADLRQYRKAWAEEAQWDPSKAALVKEADAEIKAMEAEEQQINGVEAHAKEWHQAEAELCQIDPEFMRPGTRVDKGLRELMSGPDGEVYRGHPRGIVAAYHRVKMEILESDYQVAQGKIQQLEAELKRLTGLTSIGGGAPGRIASGGRIESLSDFSKLSTADMRKHLKSGIGKGGMPWL